MIASSINFGQLSHQTIMVIINELDHTINTVFK